MQKHFDAPGSSAWHSRRAACFNAGDASAMLGCHPSGKTRTQLLDELHTGIAREFSDYVQEKVLDPGHRIEALWRPIAEEIAGEDLQVLAGTLDVGLSRPLGASLDGCTFMEDVLGECKSANEALRVALPHSGRDSHTKNDARNLPKGYRVQIEQQQLVTGATRTLFSACQFDAEGHPTEERHCWYTSDPDLRREIMAGWMQFDIDLAAYVPPAAEAPKPTGRIRESLPSLVIEAKGEITASNLDVYKSQAVVVIGEIPIPKKGGTDQEFADGKEDGKYCRGIQERAEQAIEQLTSRMGGVHDAINALEFIAEMARRKAIDVENAVAAEEKRRKDQMQIDAAAALREHVAALNARLGENYMPASAAVADFAAAVKNKRSVENMQDAVNTTLANAKISANETADRIQVNMQALIAAGDRASFPDAATLVLKATDDCKAVIAARVADQERKEAARLEAERARIRSEEEARARATAAREQQEREAAERRHREAQEAAARQVREQAEAAERRAHQATMTHANGAPMFGESIKDNGDHVMLDAQGKRSVFCDIDEGDAPAAAPAPTANVHPMPTRSPAAPAAPPTLRLGDIQKAFAPLTITAEGLASLGFPHAGNQGVSKLYHHADFPRMRIAVSTHALAAQLPQQQAA